ncbi:MAG: efflux RND transporter periplasmic adaptor subunit [Parabacteroides sp.]|nr:efflux RND transporter periplasmic adaptor subunit [Parabacteroides sp.]
MKKLVILTLSACMLGFSACRTPQKERKEKPLTVKVDTVRAYGSELSVSFPGKIKAAEDVSLAFRVSGTLLRVPADAGRRVKKGDLLAEIDPRDYRIQLAATEAEYKQVEAEAGRIIELYGKKSVPENDYDKAVYGLQQIAAKYEAHKNALEDTRLTAPFDGYVQKKLYDKDETVSAGMPVVSLISANRFEVEIHIPASDYLRQHQFRSYTAVLEIMPGRALPLQLIDIARKANANQLYTMRFRLADVPGINLAAGMTAEVTIHYLPGENSLYRLPVSAAFEKGEHTYVWVYNPDTRRVNARQVVPQELLKDGSLIVSGGAVAGEVLVSAGVHSLEEGMEVEVLPPASETNIGGVL